MSRSSKRSTDEDSIYMGEIWHPEIEPDDMKIGRYFLRIYRGVFELSRSDVGGGPIAHGSDPEALLRKGQRIADRQNAKEAWAAAENNRLRSMNRPKLRTEIKEVGIKWPWRKK